MTLRIPDDLDPSIRAGAEAAGLSLNAYIVRAARRQAVLDAAQHLAGSVSATSWAARATPCETWGNLDAH